MPPKGIKSPKRKRQYEHIKKSEYKKRKNIKIAKRIASATVYKMKKTHGKKKK